MEKPSGIQRVIIGTVVVVAAVGWFLFEQTRAKGQEYTGVIVEKYVKNKPGTLVDTTGRRKRCYIRVKTDGGDTFKVKVNKYKCGMYKEGMKVVKKKGERYPLPEGAPGSMSLDEVKKMIDGAKKK